MQPIRAFVNAKLALWAIGVTKKGELNHWWRREPDTSQVADGGSAAHAGAPLGALGTRLGRLSNLGNP